MAFVRLGPGLSAAPGRRMMRRRGVRDRGLGAASCPSVQQLEGIVDLTDPCQSAALNTIDANNAAAISSQLNPPLSPTSIALAQTFLGVPMPYAILGGIALAFLLIPSGGRRR